jgi:GWxTD domain-containing protein
LISSAFTQPELPVSIASYRNTADEKGNFTELYFSIDRNQIKFIDKDDSFLSTYEVKLTVFDVNRREKLSFSEKNGIRVLTESETNLAQDINDILTFYVQPGNYFYELELAGDGIETEVTKEGQFNAPDYSESKLQLSQIEFCTNISTDLSIQKFVKNNLLVYPNPSHKYAIRNPIVFFYAEIYNLAFDERGPDSDYELTYFLLDSSDDTAKVFATNRKEKAGSTSVVANLINARRLETGSYKLVLQVKDLTTSQMAQQTGLFSLEELPIISENDAQNFRKQIKYIVDSRTLDIYDQLDLIGKQNFMENFWKERDPSPDSPFNEFKHEYLRRWQFVNDKFGNESSNREGWQSDRGRIYLIHGSPTDIERYYGERASKDHEIWVYEGDQYGVEQFVFADLTMRGRLILIHSESRNQQEVYNPDWRREIDVR